MSHWYKNIILSHSREWDHLREEFSEKRGWRTKLRVSRGEGVWNGIRGGEGGVRSVPTIKGRHFFREEVTCFRSVNALVSFLDYISHKHSTLLCSHWKGKLGIEKCFLDCVCPLCGRISWMQGKWLTRRGSCLCSGSTLPTRKAARTWTLPVREGHAVSQSLLFLVALLGYEFLCTGLFWILTDA